MIVVGKKCIQEFIKGHSDAKSQLIAWLSEAEEAIWETTQDIKDRYSSASFLSENRVVFNIKGNSYRLLIKINFQQETVLVEKIGTHAEYSKLNL